VEAISEALAWVICRVLLATDAKGLRLAFDALDPRTAILRAVVACELLTRASARDRPPRPRRRRAPLHRRHPSLTGQAKLGLGRS
jgi:hypothetical protein